MLKLLLFIITLFLILSAIFLPVKVSLNFYRRPHLQKIEVLMKVLFIPVYLKKIKKIHLRITPGFIYQWQQLIRNLFSSWQQAGNTLHKILRPVKVNKIYFFAELGLANAAQTALAVGTFWWLVGIIHSQINCYFNLSSTEHSVTIIPNYQQQDYLLVDFSCIFELPLGHIMIIMYYFLINFRRMGNFTKEGCL